MYFLNSVVLSILLQEGNPWIDWFAPIQSAVSTYLGLAIAAIVGLVAVPVALIVGVRTAAVVAHNIQNAFK